MEWKREIVFVISCFNEKESILLVVTELHDFFIRLH